MTRDDIVAEARAWIGTPFHAGQASRHGCDCVGLLIGVRVALGDLRADYWNEPGAQAWQGYAQTAGPTSMLRACSAFLRPVRQEQPGDVILVDWGQRPQHVGILVPYRHGGLAMVHALGPNDPCKVIESRLMGSMRRVAAFAFPGVA